MDLQYLLLFDHDDHDDQINDNSVLILMMMMTLVRIEPGRVESLVDRLLPPPTLSVVDHIVV